MSYLLGSVPFSWLAARLRGVDLRAHGSGNLGATNAIRVLGPAIGVPVLLADVAKGLVAATVIPVILGDPRQGLVLACAAAAIVGHVAPVFLGFRGGKGVATAAGAFLGLAPVAVGVAAAAFLVMLVGSRFVSLASITAACALPLALWRTGAQQGLLVAGVAVWALVVFRHRTNVARLLAGTEHRVSWRKSGGAS